MKLSRPEIISKFFPLPFSRYITLHSTSKDAKTYDLWDDVIDIIKPRLDKEGIFIVQVGAKEDKVVRGSHNTCGQTSINQAAYLIENSILHLSIDSFTAHLAGHYNIPLVCLYSNNYIAAVRPYWGDKSKQILLEPDRKGGKPSFALQEHPKTINQISPETVAKAVFQLLGFDFDYPYKTIYTGELYKHSAVENVPNQVVNIQGLGVPSIIMRMDYHFNEKVLAAQLQHCPVSIVTSRPISLEIIKNYRGRIQNVNYLIDKDHSPEFVKSLVKNTIPFTLISEDDEDVINSYKLVYMEYGIVHKRRTYTKEALNLPNNSGNLYYKSNKFTLSQGKIYNSKTALDKDQPIQSFQHNTSPVIDCPEFWKDADYITVLERV